MFEDERTDGIILDDSDDLVVGGETDDYSVYEEEPEEVEETSDDEDDYDVYDDYGEEPDNEEVVAEEEPDDSVVAEEEPDDDEVDDYSAYDEGGVAETADVAGNAGSADNIGSMSNTDSADNTASTSNIGAVANNTGSISNTGSTGNAGSVNNTGATANNTGSFSNTGSISNAGSANNSGVTGNTGSTSNTVTTSNARPVRGSNDTISNEALNDIISSLRATVPDDFTDDLIKAAILSALGRLDNDVDYNTITSGNHNIDFKFGYSDLPEVVMSALELIMPESTESSIQHRIESGVLSNIRGISFDEYNADYARQDKKLIGLLSTKVFTDFNEDVINYIKTDDMYHQYYTDTVDGILGVYKYAFQDSFGLEPYKGVVCSSAPYALTIRDDRVRAINNAETTFNTIYDKLKNVLEYDVKSSRQFNIKDLLSNSSRQVKYFPKKILEYVLGRETTQNLSEDVYKCHANNRSWESYEQAYVRPQIEQYILEAIYYSLENHSDVRGSFIEDERYLGVGDKAAFFRQKFSNTEMRGSVKSDLEYIKKCLCASICIVNYNTLGKHINSISVRIVDVKGKLSTNITKRLFGDLTTNESVDFEDGDIISDGITLSDGNFLPFPIFEYRHSFNAVLAEAEPEFGYKAVELYKAKGDSINWNNILLGKDTKGTPLFASVGNSDKIPMQSNTVHNMIAGSRSGKGVMTMNILASALAAGKPIFYLDRKPDMAVMFYELTGGNMFVINGGQYEAKNDPRHNFGASGVAISGWEQAYDSMPDYMASAFFGQRTYEGNFGDYVYYRAMLFTLGILMARVSFAGNPDIYNNLGGSQGVVFVYDEYKNFQYNFESTFLEVSGKFCNKNMIKLKAVRESVEKLKEELSALQIDRNALSDDTKIAKIDLKIAQKEKALQNLVKPEQLYATTAITKLGDSIKYIATKLDAGFKDSEGSLSDIFVIGQDLEKKGLWGAGNPSGTYSQRDSGDFNNNNDTKGLSLTRGILDKFAHDYFVGYNKDFPKYIGANVEKSPAHKWVEGKRYWAYINNTVTDKITSGSGVRDAKYFKPYLVLNNNMEDDPANPTGSADYEFVRQCRDKVNEASAGLWEQVRLKHLPDDKRKEAEESDNKHYGELNAGIGFEGLAALTKSTVSDEAFNPQSDLRKSFDIANYVAGCMGYSSYKELLFDFSPNGLFSIKDMIDAIGNPGSYSDLAKRLPLYHEFSMDNLLGKQQEEEAVESQEDYYSDGGNEDNYYSDTSSGESYYSDMSSNESHSNDRGSNTVEVDAWTDEERRNAAILLFDFYLSGVESGNPQKAANLKSNNNVRHTILNSIVQMLQSMGY